jgi:hypothetical protein
MLSAMAILLLALTYFFRATRLESGQRGVMINTRRVEFLIRFPEAEEIVEMYLEPLR